MSLLNHMHNNVQSPQANPHRSILDNYEHLNVELLIAQWNIINPNPQQPTAVPMNKSLFFPQQDVTGGKTKPTEDENFAFRVKSPYNRQIVHRKICSDLRPKKWGQSNAKSRSEPRPEAPKSSPERGGGKVTRSHDLNHEREHRA